MKKMHIRIKLDGKTEIRVEGAQGDECLAFTRAMEESLGEVETRERCPEEADPLYVKDRERVEEHESQGF